MDASTSPKPSKPVEALSAAVDFLHELQGRVLTISETLTSAVPPSSGEVALPVPAPGQLGVVQNLAAEIKRVVRCMHDSLDRIAEKL
jgi:hypothetical protein